MQIFERQALIDKWSEEMKSLLFNFWMNAVFQKFAIKVWSTFYESLSLLKDCKFLIKESGKKVWYIDSFS